MFRFIPICHYYGWFVKGSVFLGYSAAYEEVWSDVVPLGVFVAVVQCALAFAGKVNLVYVVLDGVFGIGELLVQGYSFGAVGVAVVFAVTDIVDLSMAADE